MLPGGTTSRASCGLPILFFFTALAFSFPTLVSVRRSKFKTPSSGSKSKDCARANPGWRFFCILLLVRFGSWDFFLLLPKLKDILLRNVCNQSRNFHLDWVDDVDDADEEEQFDA
ncbi:hypothetical protein CC80DRAFT_495628 [Byssothecium circinans]|uniref:Uncharacterized protein n=1 Tax=Byssothecium circinans TaxID=147558 RepID=A0A6A5THA8_9PLEO|nr:hypothetical protein CC80DRAFT_495628 [Byssothecium circinans]